MLSSSEFIPELAITKELTRFRKGGEDALYRASNFSELVFARVVSGKRSTNVFPNYIMQNLKTYFFAGDYPTDLLAEWHRWKCQKKNADDAYNGCPSHYSSRDQLFLVIATAKAGTPLSKFKVRSMTLLFYHSSHSPKTSFFCRQDAVKKITLFFSKPPTASPLQKLLLSLNIEICITITFS